MASQAPFCGVQAPGCCRTAGAAFLPPDGPAALGKGHPRLPPVPRSVDPNRHPQRRQAGTGNFRPALFPGRPDDCLPCRQCLPTTLLAVHRRTRPTTQTRPTACVEQHAVDRVECRRLMHQRGGGYFRVRRGGVDALGPARLMTRVVSCFCPMRPMLCSTFIGFHDKSRVHEEPAVLGVEGSASLQEAHQVAMFFSSQERKSCGKESSLVAAGPKSKFFISQSLQL